MSQMLQKSEEETNNSRLNTFMNPRGYSTMMQPQMMQMMQQPQNFPIPEGGTNNPMDYYANSGSYTSNSKSNNKRKKNTMKTLFKKDFGPIDSDLATIDYTGSLVVRSENSNEYKKYDHKNKRIINMANAVITAKFPMVFGIPVARKDLKEGDIIKYNDNFLYIESKTDDEINTISLTTSMNSKLIPESILGLDIEYYCKLINIMNPGEGINPMMLMFLMNDDEDQEFDPMMFFAMSQLNNNNNNSKDDMNNLLPLMLMSDKDDESNKSDIMMLMMMQQNQGNNSMNNLLPLMMLNDGSDAKTMALIGMMQNANNANPNEK